MPVYTVLTVQVLLPAGTVLQLSEAQWQTRGCNVRRIASTHWFEALREIRFVGGEQLHFRDTPSAEILKALQCGEEKLAIATGNVPLSLTGTPTDTLSTVRARYHQAHRKEKSLLLDQWVAATGCHRKHAIRLFRQTMA